MCRNQFAQLLAAIAARPSPSLSAWAAALHQPRGPSVAPAPSEHLKVQPEDGVDEDADAADKDVRAVRRRDSPVRPGLARSVASIAVRAASTALVYDLTVAREHVLGALY
jgi:hypothetical protein